MLLSRRLSTCPDQTRMVCGICFFMILIQRIKSKQFKRVLLNRVADADNEIYSKEEVTNIKFDWQSFAKYQPSISKVYDGENC